MVTSHQTFGRDTGRVLWAADGHCTVISGADGTWKAVQLLSPIRGDGGAEVNNQIDVC
jgi:peptide subunit release factor RF-3